MKHTSVLSDFISFSKVALLFFLLTGSFALPAPTAPPPGTTTAAPILANSTSNPVDASNELQKENSSLSTPAPSNDSLSEEVKTTLVLTTTEVSKAINESVKMVESNSSTTTSNSSKYIIDYKTLVFDSPEDIKTQQEWGGNCTLTHWDSCKVLHSWFGNYEDPKDGLIKEYLIDCKLEPVLCLKNSWTVTRCNLLCMSRCNREIQFRFDKYVSHSGECQAHSHG